MLMSYRYTNRILFLRAKSGSTESQPSSFSDLSCLQSVRMALITACPPTDTATCYSTTLCSRPFCRFVTASMRFAYMPKASICTVNHGPGILLTQSLRRRPGGCMRAAGTATVWYGCTMTIDALSISHMSMVYLPGTDLISSIPNRPYNPLSIDPPLAPLRTITP